VEVAVCLPMFFPNKTNINKNNYGRTYCTRALADPGLQEGELNFLPKSEIYLINVFCSVDNFVFYLPKVF